MYQIIFQSLYNIVFSSTWHDLSEIALLTCGCYLFLGWLAQDTEPLLEWFCCAYVTLCVSWIIDLPTICYIMWYLIPFVILLFVMFHQHNLQKHYITWRTNGRTHHRTPEWQNLLMQVTLRAWDKNISILWIIEQHEALDTYFIGGDLQASLTPHLMELIISSSSQPLHHLWITKEGLVRAHNPHIIVDHDHLSLSVDIASLSPLLQKMHILSTQHDCTILYGNGAHRTSTIIHRAITYQNLTSQHCLSMLKQFTQSNTNGEYNPCASYRTSAGQSLRESSGQSL